MRRRDFMKTLGGPALASAWLAMPSQADETEEQELAPSPAQAARAAEKTWLFWDWWHVEHQDNVALCQSRAESTS